MAFIDDKIDVIKDDIERLRAKPHMYISHTGEEGALHLVRELVNNGIDESLNPNSPCDKIDMELNENLNQFIITDNGRGIPFDKLEDVCSYLQAGANLYKEEGDKKTKIRKAGDHGVGLTAVNAFAEKLVFVIYRDGKKGIFTFDDGKLVNSKITDCSPDKHGTTIAFVPWEKYLKKCKIKPKKVMSWLNEISYLLDPKTKFNFTLIKKGKEVGITEKFRHKNGITDMLNEMITDQMIKPIRITEKFDGDTIDAVFTYSEDDMSDFTKHRSYCNWVHTIDDGEHVNAVKVAWCKTITKLVIESLTDAEKKKYNITFEDCRTGLCAVINLVCLFPYFTGQTKQQVGNKDLVKPIISVISTGLRNYFKQNPNELKKVIAIVKHNNKAKTEAKKIKKIGSGKRTMDSFEAHAIGGYSPCTESENAELYICEGDSAKDQMTGVCDKRFQAAFKLRGNPKNVYGLTIPEMMENPEIAKLTKILGCGIGPDCNPNKCRFKRIIVFVDADIDAYNMTSLLSAYMLWAMAPLVQAGMFYRALSPLYIVKDPKNPYLLTKGKYFELFADKVVENVTLIDSDGHSLSPDEVRKLIDLNKNYLQEVKALQKYFYVESEIFEFALLHGRNRNFPSMLVKKFPEMKYDEERDSISGVYNGNHVYLELGDNFFDKCKRLYTLIHEVNNGNIYYSVVNNDKRLPGKYSLGSIFKMNEKYLPEVIERIKGIGELPENILWETVLNPKTRELVRLTCDDLEMELEKVKILHGKDASLRKEFMKGYVFNKDDLDT